MVSRCLSLGLLAVSMVACAAALLPAQALARGTCPDEGSTFTTTAETPVLRASVLCLVNVTRLQRGLPALQRDARLEAAAQGHTDDMIGRGLTHVGSDGSQYYQRISATGYPLAPLDSGEDIAQGQQTPAAVIDAWMRSPTHCPDILMPGIRDLGVGVNPGAADAGFPGPTWTQDLARKSSEPVPSTNTGPRDGCPYALAPPGAGPRPTASTSLATAITASSATVNGAANANGGGFTSYHVEYGTTTAYGGQTLERVAGTAGVTVTEALSGLSAGTYHFQVLAMNQNGEMRSVDRVFTTAGSPARPLVSTGAATAVAQTTATLNGSVNPAGLATTYRFEYGPTTSYGFATTPVAAGADTIAQAASTAIIGLTPGTLYHARMVATNSDGTSSGSDVSFTTLAPPVVVTGSATAGVTTATLAGSVDPRSRATSYRFEYGTTTSYGMSTALVSAGSGSAAQAVSAVAGPLARGTTYHFRIVATNADGTANGTDASFTTLDPPTVVTGAAIPAQAGATLNATVDPNGKATTYHFDYGTTSAYGSSTADASAGATSGPVAVAATIGSLTRGTAYHFRVVAGNADGTAYGADASFTTLDPPTVLPGAATPGPTTTTLNGSVNPNGKAATYHFDYGTTSAYGSSTANASAGSGSAAVALSSALSGLTAGTTYHYRVVATSADGTTIGGDVAFTTLNPPSATTGSASGIDMTTATLNGSVDPNGMATTYRFDYGTTTAYGQTTAAASAGSGNMAQAVSTAIGGLTPGTPYHFRVVATNGDGTANGTEFTFTTTGMPPPPPAAAPPAPPTAVTGSVSGIGTTTATLNGSVNPQGKATMYRFERGTTTAYGSPTTGLCRIGHRGAGGHRYGDRAVAADDLPRRPGGRQQRRHDQRP